MLGRWVDGCGWGGKDLRESRWTVGGSTSCLGGNGDADALVGLSAYQVGMGGDLFACHYTTRPSS